MVKKKVNQYKCPLWDIQWDRIIFDEAHHLRNRFANIHKGAKLLNSNTKWFVTGTPIQNNSSDMFSLLLLLDYTQFLYLGGDIEKINAIRNVYLRRTKKSIKKILLIVSIRKFLFITKMNLKKDLLHIFIHCVIKALSMSIMLIILLIF